MTERLSDLLRPTIVEGFTLAAFDPAATPGVDGKKEAKQHLEDLREELFDLHEMLFAAKDRAVLLVLQGMDASGKNGTIKHVIDAMNPAGVRTASFVDPTPEEEEHDFLWRIRKAVPQLGEVGVFDRSHYEDVLVPLAEDNDEAAEVPDRLEEILSFESELMSAGVSIIKCFLHISYDEQRRRFLRRLRRHDKRWKLSVADLETRRLWDEYQTAYASIISRTSTDGAPWHIIPADHKWYRNWAVATLLVECLRAMNLSYPQPELDLVSLRGALEPPG